MKALTHGLDTSGTGEMAGPRTNVLYHGDQGLLVTFNGNRTMISFLLMLKGVSLLYYGGGREQLGFCGLKSLVLGVSWWTEETAGIMIR
jgi:hypothetical protein